MDCALSFNTSRNLDRDLNQLIGICHGVLADGTVNSAEIRFVNTWLKGKDKLTERWPAKDLAAVIKSVAEKPDISADDEGKILCLMSEMVGVVIEEYLPPAKDSDRAEEPKSKIHNTSTTYPQDHLSDIKFEGKRYVLTGTFHIGNRSAVQNYIESLGGLCQKSPTMKTDYLIIGSVGSADWAHASWGRKIEKAVHFKDKGCDIKILGEQAWLDLLNEPLDFEIVD